MNEQASSVAETRSSDGTVIRWHQFGSGPPLLWVHGSLDVRLVEHPLLTLLAGHFTVVAMGRRGYGLSDDHPSYSYNQEAADVAAVAAATSAQVLAGHSSGAICVLKAALTVDATHVVAYEPPVPVDEPVLAPHHLAQAEALIASGDNDAALAVAFRHGVKLPSQILDAFRRTKEWQDAVALAPTWIREFPHINASSPEDFGALRRPTLLLWGSDTERHHRRAVEALEDVLPDARSRCLSGHGHMGPMTAASAVAEHIIAFV